MNNSAWRDTADDFFHKIKEYMSDADGWKLAKQSDEVSVHWKTSPHWEGTLYRTECVVNASPEVVHNYIHPDPSGPRSKWDKAVKGLEILEHIDEDLLVVRIVTKSAFNGLIASRDFIDLVLRMHTDDCIYSCSRSIEHPNGPVAPSTVRATNYPSAIICKRVPNEPNKTCVINFIQPFLGGMLPKSLVDRALPSNQIEFFVNLRRALKKDGKSRCL